MFEPRFSIRFWKEASGNTVNLDHTLKEAPFTYILHQLPFPLKWHLVLATHLSLFSLQVFKHKQHLHTAQDIISVTSLHNGKHSEKNSTRYFCPFLTFSSLRAVRTLSEQFLKFQKFPITSSELTNLVLTHVLLKQTEHLNL